MPALYTSESSLMIPYGLEGLPYPCLNDNFHEYPLA